LAIVCVVRMFRRRWRAGDRVPAREKDMLAGTRPRSQADTRRLSESSPGREASHAACSLIAPEPAAASAGCRRRCEGRWTLLAPCQFSGSAENSLRRRVSGGGSGISPGEHVFFARPGNAPIPRLSPQRPASRDGRARRRPADSPGSCDGECRLPSSMRAPVEAACAVRVFRPDGKLAQAPRIQRGIGDFPGRACLLRSPGEMPRSPACTRACTRAYTRTAAVPAPRPGAISLCAGLVVPTMETQSLPGAIP